MVCGIICDKCKHSKFCKFRERINYVILDSSDDIEGIKNNSNNKVKVTISAECEYFE